MARRKAFLTPNDIVCCDAQHFTTAAVSAGAIARRAGVSGLPSKVARAISPGGKIYNDAVQVQWAVHTNQTGGLALLRTRRGRVDSILFFVVEPGKGRFFPDQFSYDGPVWYISRVYWTRKRLGSLFNRLRLPRLIRRRRNAGVDVNPSAGGNGVPVSREDFMVYDEESGEEMLGAVNLFNEQDESIDDVIMLTDINKLNAYRERDADYWVA